METTSPDLSYPRAAFAQPLPYGYVYAGMKIDLPARRPLSAWERQARRGA